jgi:hypothetical protein
VLGQYRSYKARMALVIAFALPLQTSKSMVRRNTRVALIVHRQQCVIRIESAGSAPADLGTKTPHFRHCLMLVHNTRRVSRDGRSC